MKKVLLISLTLFITVVSVYAAKSTGEPHAFTQPDGTTIMVRLLGDEHHSWYQTMDDVLLKRVGKAFFIAKTMTDGTLESSGIMAHNLDSRKAPEIAAAKQQNRSLFFTDGNSNVSRAKGVQKSFEGYPSKDFCPHSGEIRIPIILIEYAKTDSDDVKFTFTKDSLYEYFNGTTVKKYTSATRFAGYSSVSKYFKDASGNDLQMVFDLYGPYTAKYGHDYYGRGNGKSYSLLTEAVGLADTDIDFTKYDSNNDGKVDMVYIMYAGTGANTSGDNSDFWPACYYNQNISTGDGVHINVIGGANEVAKYNVTVNAEGTKQTLRAGIGVTCHEMCHGLGLPDLYWTLSSTPKDSLGYVDYNNCGPEDWDLMDGGENIYNAIWPCQLNAWERDVMGWITPEKLTEPTDVTIYPLNKQSGKAYKVVNPNNANEYYIIENYMYSGWNYYIFKSYGAGLMITHVNMGSDGLSMTPNNIYGQPGVTLLPADGIILAYYSNGHTIQYKGEIVKMPSIYEKDSDGNYTYNWTNNYYVPDLQGDPYVGSKYSGDPITSVAAYKNYTKNEAGEDMVVKYPITDITRNEDGSISFKFMGGEASAISNITVDDKAGKDTNIYTIDGRLMGKDINKLPHGLYIQEGHKFVK